MGEEKRVPLNKRVAVNEPVDENGDPKYGDFLIIDLLNPDFRHFFKRYKTDIIGFVLIGVLCGLIIWATWFIANLGAGGGGM